MSIVVGYCGPGRGQSGDPGHLFYFEDHTLLRYLNWIWRIDARKMRELEACFGRNDRKT